MQLRFTNVWHFVFFVVTRAGYKYEQLLYTLRMQCGRPVLVVPLISFAFHKCKQFLHTLRVQLRFAGVREFLFSDLLCTNASSSFIHWICNCGMQCLVISAAVHKCQQFLNALSVQLRSTDVL